MPMVSPQLLPSTRLGTGPPLWDPFASRSTHQTDSSGSGSISVPNGPHGLSGTSSFGSGISSNMGPGMSSSLGSPDLSLVGSSALSPTSAGSGLFSSVLPPPLVPGSVSSGSKTSPSSALRALDDEDVLPPLNKSRTASLGSLGPTQFRPFSAGAAGHLIVQNLPRDLTSRELHLMFTFATDFVSCELSKSGKAEDGLPASVTGTVRFRNVVAASNAQSVLEHRHDLCGEAHSSSASSHWPIKCEVRAAPIANSNISGPTSAATSSTSLSSSVTSIPRNPKSRFSFMGGDEPGSEQPQSQAQGQLTAQRPHLSQHQSQEHLQHQASQQTHQQHPQPPSGPGHAQPQPIGSQGSHGSNPLSTADRMFSPASPRSNVFVPASRSIFAENEYLPPLASSLSGLHINALERKSSSSDEKSGVSSPLAGSAPSSSGGPLSATSPPIQPQEGPSGRLGSGARRASIPSRQLSQVSPENGSLDSGKVVVVPYTAGTSARAVSIMQSGGRVMPPANPADQNPPCNTLYVGNLPPDTSEEELKDLFASRPGYRRLCFRTKANGPMCFVEFEDETYAGRALEELYGFGLSNSVKGGIRLSFSKNPLGVRSSRPPQKSFGHY